MEATNSIPMDIIVYAAIAVVLVVWLSRILGTRHGAERQRPNPFTLPTQQPEAKGVDGQPVPAPTPLRNVTTDVEAGLVQISLADRNFDPARFVENAKDAFAIVVGAFAEGDKATLKDLLAPAVYRSFENAIEARETLGKKVTTEVHSVSSADVIEARLEGSKAFVTLRFKADETYVETDKDGKVIAGHPDKIVTMTDVWVFSRDVKSSDPRWFVAETRDDVKETGGRALPEAGA